MARNRCGIYMITNPDRSIYIGQAKNLYNRIRRYKSNDCKDTPLIYESVLKYGFSNHNVEVLEYINYNIDLLNERERYWIEFKKSNINKFPECNGMNLTDGGKGCYGRILSICSRDKIRKANTGLKATEQSKAKMRGERPGFIPKNSRLILNLETGIYYDNIANASKSINIKRTTLNAKLIGQNTNNTNFIYC